MMLLRWMVVFAVFFLCDAKLMGNNKTNNNGDGKSYKPSSSSGYLLAEELRNTLERYLFGICPHNYKLPLANKGKNTTALPCDVDSDHNDLAARLATLSLRAHSASRTDCSQLGNMLASTFGDLARTAAQRLALNSGITQSEASKKRKLSKSQKAKIQAKQRTALAVKKKAAAIAAAAASKVTA